MKARSIRAGSNPAGSRGAAGDRQIYKIPTKMYTFGYQHSVLSHFSKRMRSTMQYAW